MPLDLDRLDPSDPAAAATSLARSLRESRDFGALFYARLLQKRLALGAAPFPTGPITDIPAEFHTEYEDAVREAAREAGSGFLEGGKLPEAWPYFRMIGEVEPLKSALADFNPPADADIYPLVELAWQQQLLPERGFDWVLSRSGVCSAVTMVQSADLRSNADLRDYCVSKLVGALHEQLRDRLRADAEARGLVVPPGLPPGEVVRRYPELVAGENYHVDVSHLSSVVQLALQLPAGAAADLALELCDYGGQLAPALRGRHEPPFEAGYDDFREFLRVTTGRDVGGGLAHFGAKLERALAESSDDARFVAEALVNLNLVAGRAGAALELAQAHLADVPEAYRGCPGLAELSRRAGKYDYLAEAARENGDAVGYLAAVIAARAEKNSP